MIGAAQVLLSHLQMREAKDLGACLCLLFEHIEQAMEIEKVSIGVCPFDHPTPATWFRFQGELK